MSTRSSKRKSASALEEPSSQILSASQPSIQQQPDVSVLAPSADAPAPIEAAAPVAMSDADTALLHAGGPVPNPAPAGFEAAAPEESTGHKAKRMATDASKQVKEAVTAGLETAAVVIKEAAHDVAEFSEKKYLETKAYVERESQRTTGPKAATAAQAPYVLSGLPGSQPPVTLADKTHNALNTIQFAGEKAIDSAVDAVKQAAAATAAAVGPVLSAGAEKVKDGAEIAAVRMKEGAVVAAEKVKLGAAVAAENAKLGAEKLGTKAMDLSHDAAASIKSAVSTTTSTVTDGTQTGLSSSGVVDASHLVEKKDGSLPVERNTDEFPHPRSHFEKDSRIPLLSDQAAVEPIQGLPADATAKVQDAPAAKISSDAPIDLITGPGVQV